MSYILMTLISHPGRFSPSLFLLLVGLIASAILLTLLMEYIVLGKRRK